jgi:acyl carrier protein
VEFTAENIKQVVQDYMQNTLYVEHLDHADSLDIAETRMEVEDKFNIEFNDELLEFRYDNLDSFVAALIAAKV